MQLSPYPYMAHFQNKNFRTIGSDSPQTCDINVDWWNDYHVQDFDYKFNSWGYRDEDFEQYIGKKVNICLGDSILVNIGGPIEHSWPKQLGTYFDIPTLNFGMMAAGNDALYFLHKKLIELFDVQNTFVMYSFMHRRYKNGEFTQDVDSNDKNNFVYFLNHRIPSAIECAIPSWNLTEQEQNFFNNRSIFTLEQKDHYYKDHVRLVDENRKRYIRKEIYEKLKGNSWPSYAQFCKGADAHEDMYTKGFGKFLNNLLFYVNRDGVHMNYKANKIYADYFYKLWKEKN